MGKSNKATKPALAVDPEELRGKIKKKLKKELGRKPTAEEVDAKLAKKLKKLGRWPRHPAAVHGVQMLTRDEVSEIALLVANVIPLAYFEYQDRVGIFEDAVARVAKGVENTLPRQYHRLIHHDPVAHSARDPEVNAAIAPEPPPSQQQHPGAGIDSELADSISSHLVPYILETVRLPHLGACDEKRVVTAVVDIMIQSMRTDRVIWQFCKGDYSKDIIVKVFMRGSIGKLFDPFQRAELIEKVLSNVKNVPFVPMSVLETVGGMMIDWVAQHVDRALHDSYHQRVHHHHDELLARGLKYHGDAVNKDLGGDIDPPIQTPHIRIYMRKNLGKYLDESIHPMPAPASLVPWVVGQILDHAVDTDRLEHIWLNHNFVEHLHRSPHAGAPTLRELKTAMDGGGGPDGGVSGDPDGGGQRGM